MDDHAKYAAWTLAHSDGNLTEDEIRRAVADMSTPERDYAVKWWSQRHERTMDTVELEAVKP